MKESESEIQKLRSRSCRFCVSTPQLCWLPPKGSKSHKSCVCVCVCVCVGRGGGGGVKNKM
jgi:hypothetical protein